MEHRQMAMTKGERDQLLSLVRKREKVMKQESERRSAAMMAEFDQQSARIHGYDEDAVWAEVFERCKTAVGTAREAVAARCQELGIPPEFAPDIQLTWYGRGHNAVNERRTELRRAAKSRLASLEKDAISEIERLSLQAQTEIVSQGLESEAAKIFLSGLAPIEQLMPPITVESVQETLQSRADRRKRDSDGDLLLEPPPRLN